MLLHHTFVMLHEYFVMLIEKKTVYINRFDTAVYTSLLEKLKTACNVCIKLGLSLCL